MQLCQRIDLRERKFKLEVIPKKERVQSWMSSLKRNRKGYKNKETKKRRKKELEAENGKGWRLGKVLLGRQPLVKEEI